MPKRWERSLSEIPRLTETDEIWREATERAARDRSPAPKPPRRQRLVAGVVAVGVFMAGAFFAWQAFEGPGTRERVGEAGETPIPDAPSHASLRFARPAPDAKFPVPAATLEFGDFSAELKPTGTSFVKPFATRDDLPGSSVGLPGGLPLQMAGDAETATMKVYASPRDFDRDPIATYDLTEGPGRLPDRPGVYYLVVRAEWTDGWASYLWGIPVLRAGTLQFVLDDHGRAGEGTADLWIDGRHVTGAVVRRSQIAGDVGVDSSSPPVTFDDGSYIPIEAGAQVRIIEAPTELSAALSGPAWADASGPGVGFPLFGSRARVPAEPGRHLLVLDAAWQEGEIGYAQRGYREEVRFAFPVDVSSTPAPSPEPLPSGPIVITFDTSEEGKIPQATATFGGEEYPVVMNGYRFTIDKEVFASSKQHWDAAMIGSATIVVPPGASIEFRGDQDRVLVGWGDSELVPAASLSVQGSPGNSLVLRFRGEWPNDSFVEWELFFEVQAP